MDGSEFFAGHDGAQRSAKIMERVWLGQLEIFVEGFLAARPTREGFGRISPRRKKQIARSRKCFEDRGDGGTVGEQMLLLVLALAQWLGGWLTEQSAILEIAGSESGPSCAH
jgi:hypothetical protein